MAEVMDAWFRFSWFSPEVLRNFQWDHPEYFYLLLALPLIWIVPALINWLRKNKVEVAMFQHHMAWQPISLFRFVPPAFFLIAATLILTALARPQRTNEHVEQWTEGIDIMLVMDISRSMQIEDFKPDRLTAAKQTATEFVTGREFDRIGIVIFSGEAYSLAPLTTDKELLQDYINSINFDMIQTGGTAIGSALAVGTNRMRESENKSKVLILMSDGDNNAGNIDPITAAKLANAFGIKIYCVAIGQEGKVPYGKDFFGRTRYIDNIFDETTLREIAKIGEGEFYRATDNEALEQIFERIDTLEKAEIKETRYKETQDFYFIYLRWALVFFLLWLFTKSTFMSSLIVD